MRQLRGLVQCILLLFLGAWLNHNPGLIHFEWLGYEGKTSIALILIIGVLSWVLWSVMGACISLIRKIWARLWGRALPFEMNALVDQQFKILLNEGGVYDLEPHLFGCDVGRFTERHVRAQRAYCEKIISQRATAWWGYWGLVRLAYRLGDSITAYEWARKAHKSYPRHVEMTRMYFVIAVLNEDATEGLKIIPLLRRQDGCSRAQMKRLKAQLHLMRFLKHEDEPARLDDLEQSVREDETFEPALRAWSLHFKKQGQNKDVVRKIRKRWSDTRGSVPLGLIYLESLGAQGLDRFKAAVDLAEQGGEEDVKALFLSLEALRVGLWGEAKRYLAPLYEKKPHPFVVELWKAIDHNERGGANPLWDPVGQIVHLPALNEGPWICSACGHGMDRDYDALCVSCGFWAHMRCGHRVTQDIYSSYSKSLTLPQTKNPSLSRAIAAPVVHT